MAEHSILEPTDDELVIAAATGFGGQLHLPQVGESPYYTSLYRTFWQLLNRIHELEIRVGVLETEIRP